MKRFVISAVMALMMASAAFAGQAEAATTLRLGHVVADNSSLDKGLDYFAKLVSDKSGGELKIQVFPNSSLGDNTAMMEQLQFGSLDMMAPSVAALSGFTPSTAVFDLPYLFKNEAAAEEVLDGPLGDSIGKALEQALLSFSGETDEKRSRAIILITDGENHDDDAVAVAKRAAEQGIRIYTIGIGTPEGAPIEIDGEFIRDEQGEMVVSKLNEEMLAQIADLTGGAYVRATKQDIGLDEIVRSINEMEQSELSTVRFEEFNEQYQYLLIAALVLLLAEFLLLDRRNPLLAHLNIFREK